MQKRLAAGEGDDEEEGEGGLGGPSSPQDDTMGKYSGVKVKVGYKCSTAQYSVTVAHCFHGASEVCRSQRQGWHGQDASLQGRHVAPW